MDENMNYQETTEGSPRWMGIAVVGLAILSLVGVGLAWNAGGHAHDADAAFHKPLDFTAFLNKVHEITCPAA